MKKYFNIRWSSFVKSITAIFAVVFLFAAILLLNKALDYDPNALSGFIIVVSVSVAFSLNAPRYIKLSDKSLSITRLCFKTVIDYDQIECISRYNPSGDIRIFGSGGYCGFVGIFRNKEIGNYFAFIGDNDEAVYVETKQGRRYVFSCEDPDAVISIIKNRPE